MNAEDPARRAYYAEARSWADDRAARQRRGLRLAWIVASIAATIAVIEALALLALAPLKTVVPYTLLVDRSTGYVTALDPTRPLAEKPQAALTAALLAQYVVAREGFDIAGIEGQYRKVALWSADAARRDYLATMAAGNPAGPLAGNPDAPLARIPRDTVIAVEIESVTPLGQGAALVRFATERHDRGGSGGPRLYWIALLHYRFTGEPLSLADRLIDPLGFEVVQYRRDQEAPPVPMAAAAPASAPAFAPASPTIPRGPPAALPAASHPRPGIIQTL